MCIFFFFFFANATASCLLHTVFEECNITFSFVAQLKFFVFFFFAGTSNYYLSPALSHLLEELHDGKCIVRGVASGASEEP